MAEIETCRRKPSEVKHHEINDCADGVTNIGGVK